MSTSTTPRTEHTHHAAPAPAVRVTPWPVDYRTSGQEGIGVFRDNPADSLAATTMAIREWIGLIGYKFTGRIDSVFPGPLD